LNFEFLSTDHINTMKITMDLSKKISGFYL
jgi:hypothetical protein